MITDDNNYIWQQEGICRVFINFFFFYDCVHYWICHWCLIQTIVTYKVFIFTLDCVYSQWGKPSRSRGGGTEGAVGAVGGRGSGSKVWYVVNVMKSTMMTWKTSSFWTLPGCIKNDLHDISNSLRSKGVSCLNFVLLCITSCNKNSNYSKLFKFIVDQHDSYNFQNSWDI